MLKGNLNLNGNGYPVYYIDGKVLIEFKEVVDILKIPIEKEKENNNSPRPLKRPKLKSV